MVRETWFDHPEGQKLSFIHQFDQYELKIGQNNPKCPQNGLLSPILANLRVTIQMTLQMVNNRLH